tara:strand:- start:9863 stop:12235 length:2373 start_codon:yes stop_codon:yes gene_type:complete
MLTDEQILAKTADILENLDEKFSKSERSKRKKKCDNPKGFTMKQFCKNQRSRSKKGERKNESILREIEEDELRVLEDVLDDLDPANLPLNDLFSGKMRVVIPFPTTDPSTELGKFAKFFETQEYDVQWDKGTVSATREVTRVEDMVASLMGGPEKKKIKKFQMKIGKLFAKIADLKRKQRQIMQKDSEFQKNPDYKRINQQILLYIPNPGIAGPAGYDLEDLATKFGEYWKKNAGYIKKNINEIDSDKFSIIITRHPIDVLRMSDFDKITSCHSPASRTNAYQSYYKCAVAEAKGHGAVAYVVETEELLSATNTGNINSAEQEIQEGEIFADDKRPFTGDINPLSRARIRHVRYYDTDTPKRYDDGQDVGMPEKRIYGADIPGITDTVTDWARATQEEVIQNMPREDGKVDLSKFMIFGGSYEDTSGTAGRLKLMQQLLGADIEVEGSMRQNTDTEDSIDANLVGDIIAQYEVECENIMNDYNNRMAQTYTDYEVQDDGGDGAYIRAYAAFIAKFDVNDWKRLPSNAEEVVWNSVEAITDIYGDIFVPSDRDTPTIRRVREEIHLTIQINFEHPAISGGSYMAFPDEYQEALQKIDSLIDDRRDAFETILIEYFRREGQMEGGAYINLAMQIEDRDITSYEWDLETDGQYSESYETTARHTFYYDPEEFGVSLDVLKQITDSRDFRIELRRQMLEEPRKAENTEYYLQMDAQTVETGGQVRFITIFLINLDEPDIMAGLFQELVEGAMDDEDNLNVVYRRVMAQAVKARQPASMQTNESLVSNWKDYLRL